MNLRNAARSLTYLTELIKASSELREKRKLCFPYFADSSAFEMASFKSEVLWLWFTVRMLNRSHGPASCDALLWFCITFGFKNWNPCGINMHISYIHTNYHISHTYPVSTVNSYAIITYIVSNHLSKCNCAHATTTYLIVKPVWKCNSVVRLRSTARKHHSSTNTILTLLSIVYPITCLSNHVIYHGCNIPYVVSYMAQLWLQGFPY